jgi:hypothetical protein
MKAPAGYELRPSTAGVMGRLRKQRGEARCAVSGREDGAAAGTMVGSKAGGKRARRVTRCGRKTPGTVGKGCRE